MDPRLWVANSAVRSIVPDGNTLYIGGDFTEVGPSTGCGVAIDSTTGAPLPAFAQVQGYSSSLSCAVGDGTGGWFIGGTFSSVGGQPHNALAHILANGSVDSWSPPFYGYSVQAMALSGNTLYIAGSIDSIGSAHRTYLAAVDITTGAATAWDPEPDREVRAIAVHGGHVYVGGAFSAVGGAPRAGVAALDPLTGAATSWDAHMAGADGGGAEVFALLVTNAAVYAGGDFSTIGGQSRINLVALSPVTGNATSWNPAPDGVVETLASDGSLMFVGGDFTHIGGQVRGGIAALNLTSGAATSWQADADKGVYAIALDGTTLYIGGLFTTISGQARSRLAALDAATAALEAWDPHAGSSVFGIAAAGGTVYVGGALKSIGGKSRSRLAAIDRTTGAATDWNPTVLGGGVKSLVVLGGSLYAGGTFTSVGGLARSGLAKIDAATAAVSGWNPNPITDDYAGRNIETLTTDGTVLYAGGWFNTIAGVPRKRVASLNPTSGVANSWDPHLNGASSFSVDAILPYDATRVFVGGVFDSVGGHARPGVAAIDPATGLDTGWNPPFNRTASSLASLPGRILVATSISNAQQKYLEAFDASTGSPTGWNPDPQASVYAILAVDSTVFACGGFTHIGGQDRTYLAAIDAYTGNATDWNPQVDGSVFALGLGYNVLYVGGSFTQIGGVFRGGLASVSIGNGVLGVGGPAMRESFAITNVAPNPTSSSTRIDFTLPRAGSVRLSVVDLAGRDVERPVDRPMVAGMHTWTWNPTNRRLAGGVYFARIEFGGRSVQRKIVRVA